MKSRFPAAATLVSGLLLGGCYDFEAPIDPAPTIPLDPALLATWLCLAPGQGADEKPMTLAFAAADREDVYAIAAGQDGKAPDRYEAHGSEVVGRTVLNVFDPTAAGRPWNLVRYSFLTARVLRLEVVDDSPLADVEPTSWALREALERRDGTVGLYDDFCVCVRVKAEEAAKPVAAE
ncbi:MAG: hypothetical protein ABW221_10835 [Vicinamibacteria bacterium]